MHVFLKAVDVIVFRTELLGRVLHVSGPGHWPRLVLPHYLAVEVLLQRRLFGIAAFRHLLDGGRSIQVDQIVVLLELQLVPLLLFEVLLVLLDLRDEVVHVARLVGVHQTELLEVDLVLLVVVYHFEHLFEVVEGQVDAREFAAGHKLLEAEGSVEVLVELPEGAPVVAEFLLDSEVDLAEYVLDSILIVSFRPFLAGAEMKTRHHNGVFEPVGVVARSLRDHWAPVVYLHQRL